MRKYFYSTVLLFTVVFLYAQKQRFIYEYTYIPDSLVQDKKITKVVALDINESGSEFYFFNDKKNDSVFYKQNMGITTQKKINPIIFKGKKCSEKVNIFTIIDSDYLLVEDDRTLVWTLEDEKTVIAGYKTNKAYLNFAGRKWIAWYAPELPISDGPYKFRGLPGLILKIESSDYSHVFKLIGTEKMNDHYFSYESVVDNTKKIKVNSDQYAKMYREFRNDPLKSWKKNTINKAYKNGVEVSSVDFMISIEKDAKEKIKKDNNVIELDLLKK